MINTVSVLQNDHCVQSSMIVKISIRWILITWTQYLFPSLVKWLMKCGLKEMGSKGKNSHRYLIFMWIFLSIFGIIKVLLKNFFCEFLFLFLFLFLTLKNVIASTCLGESAAVNHACDGTERGRHLFHPMFLHHWLHPSVSFPSPSFCLHSSLCLAFFPSIKYLCNSQSSQVEFGFQFLCHFDEIVWELQKCTYSQ